MCWVQPNGVSQETHGLRSTFAIARTAYRRPIGCGEVLDAGRDGAEVFGTDTAAGARMDETRRFFAFLRREVPELPHEWDEVNASFAERSGGPGGEASSAR
ncbi:hypothetical protein [Nonomuraea rhizosphaerae]|uniref:hypothetical protein n=1 Tax=Nonomuraea rhizosphaerae TaxID=2665663 RepID=UPI001C5F29B0|nr:hypothetical protein [Nonomuraea rhizosphaerae]